MTNTEASANAYTSLVAKIKGENRLGAFQAPAYESASGHFVVVDFEVDLEQAYSQASRQKAKTLQVFADTVRVPEQFVHALGDGLQLLSVVARSVQVQGTRASVQLKYDKGKSIQPVVRILADEMAGEFVIYMSGQPAGRKKLAAAPKTESLRFTSYTCNEQGVVQTQGKLPLAMLDLATPLYQVLTASFDVAAGAMRNQTAAPEQDRLAGSLLKWLVRWAAYPSPHLARLFEDAQALSRLVTVTDENSQVIYNIPPRPSEDYLALARSQMAVAEKYELDENFKGVRDTIKDVVGRVVKAWIARDNADLGALDQEIEQAKELTAAAKKAVEKAAKQLEDQKFETTLQGITLEGALAEQRIMRIVKASFEIFMGLVQLGASIAAVGANPGLAGALSNVNPFDLLKDANPLGGERAPLYQRLGMTLALLYTLPVSLYGEYKSMGGDDKKQLGKSVSAAGPAVLKLYGAAFTLMKIDKPLEKLAEIGDLVSHAAGVPDTIESKAIWEGFAVEAVNQLELITRDPDASAAVIGAALAYKTCMQKFAIYGRLYSEQQALLAQRIRELGTMLIRKAAAEQKQAALTTLRDDLSDRDQAIELLSRVRRARTYELRQTFFAALAKFRAAYFYENLDWPAKMPLLVVPTDAGEMKEILSDITRAQKDVSPQTLGDITKVKEIKKSESADFFVDLQSHQEAKFQLRLDDKLFDGHHLVRLNRVRARLIGTGQDLVTTELLSDTGFQDRRSSHQTFSFSGDPVFIAFQYKGDDIQFDPRIDGGVRPTPFTTWTLGVKGEGLALDNVTQVNVELIGKSVMKRS
ncbi:MAG: hypothetical protein QOH49_3929 [Acidobacteriota bacterium]|jgi:hypothetical protein|nr:hypothetical protein [Acidobacteriota bacterium]